MFDIYIYVYMYTKGVILMFWIINETVFKHIYKCARILCYWYALTNNICVSAFYKIHCQILVYKNTLKVLEKVESM